MDYNISGLNHHTLNRKQVSRAATFEAMMALGWNERVDGLERAAAIERVRADVTEYTASTVDSGGYIPYSMPGVIDAFMALHPDITLADQPSFVLTNDLVTLVYTMQLPWGLPDPAEVRLTVLPAPFEGRDDAGEVTWLPMCERLFLVANLGDPAEQKMMSAASDFLDAAFRLELRQYRVHRAAELGAPASVINSMKRSAGRHPDPIVD